MLTPPRDDTRENLAAEAELLYRAAQIMRTRFRTGKHDGTADATRKAAAELASRARHPSRQHPVPGRIEVTPDA